MIKDKSHIYSSHFTSGIAGGSRSIELLAPAKNLECGIAAIDHGADAIYIGASRFGARQSVLRILVSYANMLIVMASRFM